MSSRIRSRGSVKGCKQDVWEGPWRKEALSTQQPNTPIHLHRRRPLPQLRRVLLVVVEDRQLGIVAQLERGVRDVGRVLPVRVRDHVEEGSGDFGFALRPAWVGLVGVGGV